MNVIRFSLEISKKKFRISNNSIKEYIIDKYSKSVGKKNGVEYSEKVKEAWINIEHKNIKSLYSPDHIIALGLNHKLKYYIFNENNEELLNNDEMDIDVLIICNNNMNSSINYVIKHIKKIIPHTTVKVVKDENICVYRNNENNDDIEINSNITASFSPTFEWYKPEVGQMLLITMISIIVLIVAINNKSNDNVDMKNILLGMGASGLIAELSQFAIRIFEAIRKEERIEITDLNSFINNEFASLFSNTDDVNRLKNPQNCESSSFDSKEPEFEEECELKNPTK